MSSLLDRLYRGCLAGLQPPALQSPPEDGSVPATQLVDREYLGRLLARFASRYPGGDRRAAASLWSKWHFSALLAPGLAANLLLDHELPLDLTQARLYQSRDGQTERFVLLHEGGRLPPHTVESRFAALIDGHLAPLIDALAACTGASPRVFWSNAGNYFEYFATAIATHPLARPDSAKPAFELLERRQLADGRRNPLYRPVRYEEREAGSDPRRVRRLCCIRYLIDELGYCGNCPLTGCHHIGRPG